MCVAEPAVTIIAASIPNLRVLLKDVMTEEASKHSYRLSAFGNIRDGDKPVPVDLESIQLYSKETPLRFDVEFFGMSSKS